ncbi:MAG: enoyl-CoA hydratase/isomerase family protein [Nitrospirae bacterium]|nr:enoyl-CoA hydratase/isomerase family protein [Nitrospirota bacterium]
MDGPGSSVNVLTRAAAEQLGEVLDDVERRELGLIVFRSLKPYSFINGAELLVAKSVKTMEDLPRLTEVLRSAYERVASLPVPTLAAIRGNCFGCGMEFTLGCDYRVAADSYDTFFYMTELRDYHCLPVFGGLSRLPRLVGLKPAVDLLLWGEKWWAPTAFERGLISGVLGAARFEAELDELVEALLGNGLHKRVLPERAEACAGAGLDWPAYRQHVEGRIKASPPDRQGLYRLCLDILGETASPRNGVVQTTRGSDVARPLGSPANRAAASFFFIRTMAKVASAGTSSTVPARHVTLEIAPSAAGHPFVDVLRRRPIAGLMLRPGMPRGNGRPAPPLRVVDDQTARAVNLEIAWGYQEVEKPQGRGLLYFPGAARVDLCELMIDAEDRDLLQPFLVLLPHLGWHPIVLTGAGDSAVNRLIRAYFGAIESTLDAGGRMGDVTHSLWAFGFDHTPAELAADLFGSDAPPTADSAPPGRSDPEALTSLLLALYREGLYLERERRLRHASQVDVIVRSLSGFPLSRGAFTGYMKQMMTGVFVSEPTSAPVAVQESHAEAVREAALQ